MIVRPSDLPILNPQCIAKFSLDQWLLAINSYITRVFGDLDAESFAETIELFACIDDPHGLALAYASKNGYRCQLPYPGRDPGVPSIEIDALCTASGSGACKVVEYLIEKGININIRGDYSHESPLCNAALGGEVEAARLLLRHGAEVDSQVSVNKHTALLSAILGALWRTFDEDAPEAVAQALRLIDLFYENGADVNNASNELALHLAIRLRSDEIILRLLRWGARLEATDYANHTPLMVASQRHNTAIIRILLDKGANIHAQVPGSHVDSFCLATIAGYGKEDFESTRETLEVLLEYGADVNSTIKVDLSDSDLSEFAESNLRPQPWVQSTEIFQPLSDVSRLSMALITHVPQLIDFLLEAGAQLECADRSSLLVRWMELCPEWQRRDAAQKITQILIRHGADVNKPNSKGTSPFIEACTTGMAYNGWTGKGSLTKLDIIKEMAENGDGVSGLYSTGKSPVRIIYESGMTTYDKFVVLVELYKHSGAASLDFEEVLPRLATELEKTMSSEDISEWSSRRPRRDSEF